MEERCPLFFVLAFSVAIVGCGGSGGGKSDGGGRTNDGGGGDAAVSMPDVVSDAADGPAVVNDAGDGAAVEAATEVAAGDASDGPGVSDGGSSDVTTSDATPADSASDAVDTAPRPCQPVTDGAYYIDPVAGSNASGTGSSACPFASLGFATKAILDLTVDAGGPTNVPAGTKILLRRDTAVADFTLPPNVTLSSEVPASPRTITVASGANGFLLVAPGSALANLVIDGMSKGLIGIRVGAGTVAGLTFYPDSTTTTLTNVKVTNMIGDGILVSSGGLGIHAGVVVTFSGFNTTVTGSGHSGLHITGGSVIINVGAGEAPTSFDLNDGNGIEVEDAGQLTLTGKPDLTGFPANDPPAVVNGTGTVTANGNILANVAIAQQSVNAQPCVIDGLVSWKSNGPGLGIAAGSSVTVRNSVFARNVYGVDIGRTYASLLLPTNLNLGDDVPGRNIIQVAGANANYGAGLCVEDFGNASVTIPAKGNFFSGKDCSVATVPATMLNVRPTDCQLTSDVGVQKSGGSQQTNVKVDLSSCQSP